MRNIEIRMLVSENNLKYKDVARAMNITRQYLSRIMSEELTSKNKERILDAINKLTDEKKQKITPITRQVYELEYENQYGEKYRSEVSKEIYEAFIGFCERI